MSSNNKLQRIFIVTKVSASCRTPENVWGIRNFLKEAQIPQPTISVGSKNAIGTTLTAIGGIDCDIHSKTTIEYGGSKIIIDTTDETEPKSIEIHVDNTKELSLQLEDFKNVVGTGKLTVHSKTIGKWIGLIEQWKDCLYHLDMDQEGDNSAAIALADFFENEPKTKHPRKLLSIEVSVAQAHDKNEGELKGLMRSLTENVPATVLNISFRQPSNNDRSTKEFSKELCPTEWTAFYGCYDIGCKRGKAYLENLLAQIQV